MKITKSIYYYFRKIIIEIKPEKKLILSVISLIIIVSIGCILNYMHAPMYGLAKFIQAAIEKK